MKDKTIRMHTKDKEDFFYFERNGLVVLLIIKRLLPSIIINCFSIYLIEQWPWLYQFVTSATVDGKVTNIFPSTKPFLRRLRKVVRITRISNLAVRPGVRSFLTNKKEYQ